MQMITTVMAESEEELKSLLISVKEDSSELTDTTRYPRLILYIYCLISRISHFSKEPSFFLLYVDKHFFSEQRETKFFLPQLYVLFFSFLILLARTSSTVLNRRPQRRYPCLFPDHRWQALRKLPYIPSLLRPFLFLSCICVGFYQMLSLY